MTNTGVANLLLHNQRQVIAWLQENLVHFGRDKSCVTIMGESAGAGNVGHHLLSPDEVIFGGAIAESNEPFASSHFPDGKKIERAFRITLNEMGCAGTADHLDCLLLDPRTWSFCSLLFCARWRTAHG